MTASLDGTVLCSHKSDYSDADPAGHDVGYASLGLCSWSATRFHSVTVAEIGAPGRPVRRMDAANLNRAAFAWPAPVTSSASLLEMTPLFQQVGWHHLMKNQALDGRSVIVDGNTCGTFLFAHADSSLVYAIPAGAMGFRAKVVTTTGNKSVHCVIYVDGNEAMITKTVAQQGGQIAVQLPLPSGAREIELRLNHGGNGTAAHSVWAEPAFVFAGTATTSAKPE